MNSSHPFHFNLVAAAHAAMIEHGFQPDFPAGTDTELAAIQTQAGAQAAPEIKDAVFSRLEIRTLPVELRTEVDSADPANVKLTVTVGVDRNKLPANQQRLTAVVALFDDNGSFVAGNQGSLDPRPAFVLKTSFIVKPGGYRVRLVVHDEHAQILEAQDQAVTVR